MLASASQKAKEKPGLQAEEANKILWENSMEKNLFPSPALL